MKKIGFGTQMVIASVLGLVAGIIFGPAMANIRFLGDIFLRLIQMSVVILVMGAIIESVGSLEPRELGKLGGKAIALFLLTSGIAAAIGLLLVNLIKPGVGVAGVTPAEYNGSLFEGNALDLLVNFFPRNIIESMAQGNVLQVIVFAALFGMAISSLRHTESGMRVYTFVQSANVIIMQVITIVMKFAPIGVFALLGGIVGTIGIQVVVPLAKFLLAMALGCLLSLAFLLTVVGIYGRLNPFRLLKKLSRTIIVAVTTNSSAISLPTQMKDSEERIGISKRVSRLVNPLAMSLNSNGLAITISIACITVAQFFGIHLTLTQQIVIVLVSIITTLGNLLVPGGALVAMAIAFQMTGLPLEGIAILAGVDWFAGLARTLLNVVGDVLTCTFIAISENEFDRTIFDADQAAA